MPGIITRGKPYGSLNGLTPVAVIDIGSNSIRLVVYEGAQRAPTPVFNEKVLCGLARGLDKSGRLSDESVEMALASLARFRALTEAMGVERVDVVATAAVRDAENGAEFVAEVENRCGFEVRVLTGEEEARLSAAGVLSGIPEASGIMGDLGGGSAELVLVGDGKTGAYNTLPLGPLRLADLSNGSFGKARKIIDKKLAGLDWLKEAKGSRFYPVGGAWRMLARVHMLQSDYPLHVIHQYTVPSQALRDFCKLLGKLSVSTLKKTPGIARQRAESAPYAAYLMQRIVEESGVDEVVFFRLRPARRLPLRPTLTACPKGRSAAGDLSARGRAHGACHCRRRGLISMDDPVVP